MQSFRTFRKAVSLNESFYGEVTTPQVSLRDSQFIHSFSRSTETCVTAGRRQAVPWVLRTGRQAMPASLPSGRGEVREPLEPVSSLEKKLSTKGEERCV